VAIPPLQRSKCGCSGRDVRFIARPPHRMPPSFGTVKLDAIEDRLDEMERRKSHGS
jgi:hypothetical protein